MSLADGPWGVLALALVLIGLVLYVMPVISRIPRLEAQVRRQGATIDQLCARLGVESASLDSSRDLDEQERALIAKGEKIAAIKHHRERTGSSLSEARDAVEGGIA
ncbi:hypothetical protein [Gephyromycinifex aptenodytis]|uniref:hypothetical protein n=1 Tax=Gephyromycinifex aptenodytis TaxID=2716227 RepID=UPI001448611F|nr:hypothetical protein [Gephyromycinifex aptenodytis]